MASVTEDLRSVVVSALLGFVVAISSAHADPIKIVAAESVYGDIARQIGGANVTVTSNRGRQVGHLQRRWL
jgi:ABC-type Zn uptake system ZnuABC Zn-binding protein ZnuA